LEAPSGEVLVKGDTAQGRRYVAITADGYLTDYPLMYDHNKQVVWDNPEWFSEEFKASVAKQLRSEGTKQADTADNPASEKGGEGAILPKTDAEVTKTAAMELKIGGRTLTPKYVIRIPGSTDAA